MRKMRRWRRGGVGCWGVGRATLSSQARRDLDSVGTGSVEAEMWRAAAPAPHRAPGGVSAEGRGVLPLALK